MEQADKLHKEICEGDCTMKTYVMSDIHGWYDECGLKDGTCLEILHKMSALTHAHLRSKMSGGIYFYSVQELAKRNKPLEELLQNAMDLIITKIRRTGIC